MGKLWSPKPVDGGSTPLRPAINCTKENNK